jgi:RNA polymerase sigma-70 factor, ECF subfamily
MDEEDKILLERYGDGDAGALGELVEKYRRPLFAFILRMNDGKEAPEDVFQDVWYRAIRKIDTFRRGSLLSWLFRIAHNLIIDNARRNRRFAVPDTGEDGEYADGMQAVPDDSRGPRELAGDLDARDIVARSLALLPAEQREVFLLRTEGDLPFKEIARIQGVSINTALARMQYALGKLRKELGELIAEEGVL